MCAYTYTVAQAMVVVVVAAVVVVVVDVVGEGGWGGCPCLLHTQEKTDLPTRHRALRPSHALSAPA